MSAQEQMTNGDLSVVEWPPSGGVVVRREGDDLNEPEGMHLSRDEARWLFQVGGPTVLYRTEPERKGRR